jgi:SAM-dependent methyltransferase
MDFERLLQLQEKPAPFTPGERLFWDDPHISRGMLAAHLDPESDLASRRPEMIDRSVAWLVETLNLTPGSALLDLGCGPGLYASRFAARGCRVTGVDLSPRSIDYAEQYARDHGLAIQYRCQNYLELDESGEYEAALLIYGDFCPLSPAQRDRLLANVHLALKPGGAFVLDVTTRLHRQRYGSANGWYLAENGFWKPGLNLVLEQGFDYPEQSIFLDQAIVIEADQTISVYRNWFQDYTKETITAELEEGGFQVESVWSDLAGAPHTGEAEWIGVIARRAPESPVDDNG